MSRNKFGFGLFVGALLGAAAGILAAPKSGKETREDLKKKADSVKSDIKSRAQDATNKMSQTARDTLDKIQDRTEELKEEVTQVEEEAGRNASTIKPHIEPRNKRTR